MTVDSVGAALEGRLWQLHYLLCLSLLSQRAVLLPTCLM